MGTGKRNPEQQAWQEGISPLEAGWQERAAPRKSEFARSGAFVKIPISIVS